MVEAEAREHSGTESLQGVACSTVVDSSEIREGKLEELKTKLTELADFVTAKEPQLIAYSVYLDEEGNRMTVVQIHPDSASMELHMEVPARSFGDSQSCSSS